MAYGILGGYGYGILGGYGYGILGDYGYGILGILLDWGLMMLRLGAGG